jgi:hypothetical protein
VIGIDIREHGGPHCDPRGEMSALTLPDSSASSVAWRYSSTWCAVTGVATAIISATIALS